MLNIKESLWGVMFFFDSMWGTLHKGTDEKKTERMFGHNTRSVSRQLQHWGRRSQTSLASIRAQRSKTPTLQRPKFSSTANEKRPLEISHLPKLFKVEQRSTVWRDENKRKSGRCLQKWRLQWTQTVFVMSLKLGKVTFFRFLNVL